MRNIYRTLREWADHYEPAAARALAAAFFQILVVAGVALGNWPAVVDAVLGFLALAATLLAGKSIRDNVVSPATHEADVLRARLAGYSQAKRERFQA